MADDRWGSSDAQSVAPPPRIRSLDGLTGVELVDRIEGSRGVLLTDSEPAPAPASAAAAADGPFCFPVSTAASVSATTFRTPNPHDIFVRASNARVIGTATGNQPVSLPFGRYTIEFSSFPVKLYLAVEAAVKIHPTDQTTRVELSHVESVFVGARSHHRQPARSVVVPQTPAGVRRAVSAFGQTLKTHSPERSFGTLRGHPPTIVWTDDQSATDAEPPCPPSDPPATIHVPDDYASVFQVAPLAYYLGATVESGSAPALEVGGTRYPLGAETGPRAFEAPSFPKAVNRVLKHLLTLDCVVRTVGFYDVNLQGATRLAQTLSLDRQSLYEASLPARTQAYLALPHEPVAEVAPQWSLTTDMTPRPAEARALPYLAARLAHVRVHEPPLETAPDDADGMAERGGGPLSVDAPGGAGPTSTDGGTVGSSPLPESTADSNTSPPQVDLPETLSQQHVWTGAGTAQAATTTRAEDFARSAERKPDDLPEQVAVEVLCTDDRMEEETVVRDLYGNRNLLEYQVNLHDDATKATVRGALNGDSDLVHYIGHATPEGLVCDDGLLQPAEVSEIGPDLAVLNGCESERLARAFADRGLLAAVATTQEVQNRPAARLGTAAARLLNAGWPVNAAFTLLSRIYRDTEKYAVIGDGTISLVQHGDGVPTAFTVWRDEMELHAQVPDTVQTPSLPDVPPGKVGVLVETFTTPAFAPGSFYTSYLDPIEERSLTGGYSGHAVVSPETLIEKIGRTAYPVFIDRRLHWACDLEPGTRPLIAE